MAARKTAAAPRKAAGGQPPAPAPDRPARARRRASAADPEQVAGDGASYFAGSSLKTGLTFVSSGCALMDCALGGGYVVGRCVNIVGDKSAGKTLKAMEVSANFAAQFPGGAIRYAESEAAFDQPYAAALGIPVDRIEFNPGGLPMQTIEDLYDDLVRFMDANKGRTKLYVVDSLDALSTDAEMEAKFNEASYGGGKPKAIGQLFRRLIQRMEDEGLLFVVVSQIRDKMDARPFQETKTRTGGKALDFYASHIVWLAETGKIKRTVKGVERVVGVDVRANVRKNKVGLPFRQADYPILFGYGIDDLTASADWLVKNGRADMLAEVGMSKAGFPTMIRAVRDRGGPEARELRERLGAIVRREWAIIETDFLPQSRKY